MAGTAPQAAQGDSPITLQDLQGLLGGQSQSSVLGKGGSYYNDVNVPVTYNGQKQFQYPGGSGNTTTDFLNYVAHLPKDDLSAFQKSLVDTPWGASLEGKYNPGQWDVNFQAVLGQVAYQANAEGKDLYTYLQDGNNIWKKAQAANAARQGASGPSQSQKGESAYMDNLTSIYLKTWGTAPPPGYIERAAKSGMNMYEFENHERAKPAFQYSAPYQYQRINLEGALAEKMGFSK